MAASPSSSPGPPAASARSPSSSPGGDGAREPDKADQLRSLGADAILGRNDPLPRDAFAVVIDLVAGPRWPELVESLRGGGRYAVAGAIAGPIVELDVRTLYLRDLSFFGCTYQPDKILEDLVRYIEAEEIRPSIARTSELSELPAAQEAFLSRKHVGNIGITVSPSV